jgi:hypothetical protein
VAVPSGFSYCAAHLMLALLPTVPPPAPGRNALSWQHPGNGHPALTGSPAGPWQQTTQQLSLEGHIRAEPGLLDVTHVCISSRRWEQAAGHESRQWLVLKRLPQATSPLWTPPAGWCCKLERLQCSAWSH